VGCSVCYPLIWLFSEGFGNFSVSFEVSMFVPSTYFTPLYIFDITLIYNPLHILPAV